MFICLFTAGLIWVSVSCNHSVLTNSRRSAFWPGSVSVALKLYIGVREQGGRENQMMAGQQWPSQCYLCPWFPDQFQLTEAGRTHLPSGSGELQRRHGAWSPIDCCFCLQLVMAFINSELTIWDHLVFPSYSYNSRTRRTLVLGGINWWSVSSNPGLSSQ